MSSMTAGRLVLLCGAGLSMAPPSELPSALRVAEECYDRYAIEVDPTCDASLRQDLEGLAGMFSDLRTLTTMFIDELVPWQLFVAPPNAGHAAVADFLLTGAAAGALSSNYDELIERQARSYGGDLYPALDGDEAQLQSRVGSPLLKFHGCMSRDRRATVWARSQLTDDAIIAARIAKSARWMAQFLREKDLLVVGFWSDWSYLNDILTEAMRDVAPASVTLVSPDSADDLMAKAPGLWDLAHAGDTRFAHVRESGHSALNDLRRAFSANYLRQVLASGRAAFELDRGTPAPPAHLIEPDLGSEDLYTWRRDAEGVPATRPARARSPAAPELLGFVHLLLREAGAKPTPTGYLHSGRTVRVVNGAGCVLASVRSRFKEPSIGQADVVVCAGAQDLGGLPDNVVRAGSPGSIIRPAPISRWLDLPAARTELAI